MSEVTLTKKNRVLFPNCENAKQLKDRTPPPRSGGRLLTAAFPSARHTPWGTAGEAERRPRRPGSSGAAEPTRERTARLHGPAQLTATAAARRGLSAPRPRGAAAQTRYLRPDGPLSPHASPGSRQHHPPLPAASAATIFVKGKVWRSPPLSPAGLRQGRRDHVSHTSKQAGPGRCCTSLKSEPSCTPQEIKQTSPQAAPQRGQERSSHLIRGAEAKPSRQRHRNDGTKMAATGREVAAAADYTSQHAVLHRRAPGTAFPARQGAETTTPVRRQEAGRGGRSR